VQARQCAHMIQIGWQFFLTTPDDDVV
jgi:hypothetical protein